MINQLWNNGAVRLTLIVVCTFLMLLAIFLILWFLPLGKIHLSGEDLPAQALIQIKQIPEHIKTPDSLRAVYISSWAAGSSKFRQPLMNIIDNTEVNAVVIDVKDYTGRISFEVEDPKLREFGSVENRVPDMREFIQQLHEKGVYVIARISSFQDSYLIKSHPEWAVKTKTGEVWRDYKGVKWLDAGAKPVWDYLVAIGNEAYNAGFDELNFDYIRFPSDGDMSNISYTWSAGLKRRDVMNSFFSYINSQFASTSIVTSADLFGLTTSATDDLGIGQILEDALRNFDYVAPMVYPSHFGKGYDGIAKPAEKPYEIVFSSMSKASERALRASTTPMKLRPWLQAFDLGAVYTPAMVRAQIQATYDVGLDDWMLWDAGSIYSREFFAEKNAPITRKTNTINSVENTNISYATSSPQ